jgi:hypothetical protein
VQSQLFNFVDFFIIVFTCDGTIPLKNGEWKGKWNSKHGERKGKCHSKLVNGKKNGISKKVNGKENVTHFWLINIFLLIKNDFSFPLTSFEVHFSIH